MESSLLEVRRAGRVSIITLNRPEQRNPLSTALLRDLATVLREGDVDDGIGAFVLTGAGRSFSAGADLQEFSALLSEPAPVHWDDGAVWADLMTLMPQLAKPIVAAVNGHALAGACGLVALCDMALAAEDAVFGLPEINIGLFPLFIMPALLRTIGRRHTLDLALSGRTIGADEAARMGLVTRVVAAEQLMPEAMALAGDLAAKKSGAMRMGRHALNVMAEMQYGEAIHFARAIRGAFFGSAELRAGIDGFLTARQKEK